MSSKPLAEMSEEEVKAAKRREQIALIRSEQLEEGMAELDVAGKVFTLLFPLGEDGAKRVMRWLSDRIGDFPSLRYYTDEVPF